jgi:hypothetical protein
VPDTMGAEMLSRAGQAPELGVSARHLSWPDAFALAAAHIWVTPPPRPLLYWWELQLLAQVGGESMPQDVIRRAKVWGLQLPLGLAARAAASLFRGQGCSQIGDVLLADLRPPERRVLSLAARRSPQTLPLAKLAVARLLAGRPSRMGWRAPMRRLWAHPGIVELYSSAHWPWPWRRLWYLLRSWQPSSAQHLGRWLERRYPQQTPTDLG